MSLPSGSASKWTYADYARLPDDGNRYEVIDGEVCVTTAQGLRHQRAAAQLFFMLRAYVNAHGIGEMLWDVDVLFVEGQYLRPDFVFVPRDATLAERGVYSAPGLVVEVLSPGSIRLDRVKKPPRYRDFGVPEYWVVDPVERHIEVPRFATGSDAPEICAAVVRWQPDPGVPAFELRVPEVFHTASLPTHGSGKLQTGVDLDRGAAVRDRMDFEG